ncbi:MAG: tetratricopeptide repeat protein [Armatimonadota bacterium]|nr:tetratricopeptide repeat protein [Armatimonadota bacterium]
MGEVKIVPGKGITKSMIKSLRANPHLSAILILIAITLAVYIQTTGFDFINFDDPRYVSENPKVQAGLTKAGVVWAFTTGHESNWHPLTWLSHMLDCQIFGLKPWGHHLTNLLFHILNTMLLFLVISRMTGYIWRSAFVAALFAIHPLHVESVAWIAERKDVLSAFFWMLTMLAYIRYSKSPSVRRYIPLLLVYALGLMAKPMLVTLPIVLLLLDYWPLRRYEGEKKQNLWHFVLEKFPLFALTIASSVVTYIFQQKGGSIGSPEIVPFGARISNALVAYVTYIIKMFWPDNLTFFYRHPGRTLEVWQVIGSAVVLALLTVALLWNRRRRPYLAVGWLWYLVTLVPVIGLVQVGSQAMADRYTYVPLIGIFLIITWGISELFAPRVEPVKNQNSKRPAPPNIAPQKQSPLVIPACIVVLLLMAVSYKQVSTWRNSMIFNSHAIEVQPNNPLPHFLLAGELEKHGDLEKAIDHYSEAVSIKPGYFEAWNNLGIAQVKEGNIEEAIESYREALLIRPNLAEVHNNLGIALVKVDRLDEAVTHYERAIILNPNSLEPRANLGKALYLQGKFDEAIARLSEALRIDSNYTDAHCCMGLALARQGKLDQAISKFKETLRIDPSYGEAYNNLAVTLFLKGDYDGAWEQIHLCRRHGCAPPPRFVEALSSKMPEPVE